jgi:hypothetical protein
VGLLWPSVYRNAVAITLPVFEGWSERESGRCGCMKDIYQHWYSFEAVSSSKFYKASRSIILGGVISACRTSSKCRFAASCKMGLGYGLDGGQAESWNRCGRCSVAEEKAARKLSSRLACARCSALKAHSSTTTGSSPFDSLIGWRLLNEKVFFRIKKEYMNVREKYPIQTSLLA